MPEALQLPPVAQAIIGITAIAVAITRLLTASRPFWAAFPAWVQKGLPAAAMAVAAIPLAIEHARTWLDVVLALMAVVGTWYTASRGDTRPPVDKDGGPRLERVHSDPKVDPGPWNDKSPPSLPGVAKFVATGAMLAVLLSCSSFGQQLSDPCSKVSWATVAAGCELRIERECAAGDQSCPVYVECTRARKEWQACQ